MIDANLRGSGCRLKYIFKPRIALGISRVESKNSLRFIKGENIHYQGYGADNPFDAFVAGWGGQRAGISEDLIGLKMLDNG